MKKKKLVLFMASLLGFGLVGGTLAGWAVTDNAGVIGIKVSPGTISSDNKTGYVTLEWGAQQSIGNVGSLKRNTVRKAGVLDVRANTASTDNITGNLRYKVTGSADLLAKLHVEIYSGNIPATDDLVSAAAYDEEATYALNALVTYNSNYYKCTTAISTPEEFNADHWQAYTKVNFESADSEGFFHKNVAAVKNQENLYSVLVYLDSSTTTIQYDDMASSVVDISFDWGIGTGEQLVKSQTLYVSGISTYEGDGKIYAYAYDSTDEHGQNKEWPGVEMTYVTAGIYSVEVRYDLYDTIIFNNGKHDGGTQTANLVINTTFGYDSVHDTFAHNYYVYGAESPVSDYVATADYYLVGTGVSVGGTELSWAYADAGKFTMNNGVGTLSITTTVANAEMKVTCPSNGLWYGENTSSEGNYVIPTAGSYTLTFTLAGPTYLTRA